MDIELMTQSLLELVGRGKSPFHGHLLIEKHAQQQRQWVAFQQRIRGDVLAQHQRHLFFPPHP
jgi:hypothetical protein